MEITEISIRLRNENKLKAFVNVTFDNQFAVKGLKIIQSKKGLLLCMPSRKADDGAQRDIAHPITKDFRNKLEQEIIAEYHRAEKRAERGELVYDESNKEEWAYVDDEL